MKYAIEKHLIDMGILPATALDELEDRTHDVPDDLIAHRIHMAKGYFNDPRDPITGEVPF